MKFVRINKLALKKSRKIKIFSMILAGVIFASGLTGCSKAYETKVEIGDESYYISSLDVLINENKDYYICNNNNYKSITETSYGYRYGYGLGYCYTYINGEYKYEYGYGYCYSYGPITETDNYYEYIDIASKNIIANDEDMKGYVKNSLSSYFNEEEYENMDGQISYYKVKEKVEETTFVNTK